MKPDQDAWEPGCGRPWSPQPGRLILRSVEACEQQKWSIATWQRAVDAGRTRANSTDWLARPPAVVAGASEPDIAPFLCGSWRCRRCARWRGALDWHRCSAGIQKHGWWLYCVLTLDPGRFSDPWAAFRAAGVLWDEQLRPRLREAWGRFDYLQTWERHRSGMPHLNLLLHSADLRSDVELSGVTARRRIGASGERTCLLPREQRQDILKMLVDAGQGWGAGHLWVEVFQPGTADGMAGYLVKLASELTGAACKGGDQTPLYAPRHFRRIRASRGLLPGRPAGGERTGTLLRSDAGRHLAQTFTGVVDPGRRQARQARYRVPWGALDRMLREKAAWTARKWAGNVPEIVESSEGSSELFRTKELWN